MRGPRFTPRLRERYTRTWTPSYIFRLEEEKRRLLLEAMEESLRRDRDKGSGEG